jgi:GTP-binding protein HflX
MLQTALIAKRVADGDPETAEIRELTEAAGARVVGEVTQTRHPDPGTELGAGKVEDLAALVTETGADTVVVDNELTPRQTVNLEAAIGATVVDRHRVVLEIFGRQARSRRGQLQVELARLRYRLPRIRERADEGALNRRTEKGTRYYDVEDRIDEIERQLDDLPAIDEQLRERRREEGFDFVALAGYTNAGKSTLLRRLADEMTLDERRHDDLAETVAIEDRLFETLETTRRRATIRGRETLVTDTVGFLEDLPHWLVESFRGTLAAVEAADAVVLVADLAQPTHELRRKLETVRETLGEEHPPVVTVLNKADLVDGSEQERKTEAIADLAPEPVVVSALADEGLERLARRIASTLPDLERTEVTLPLTDDAMSVLSWLHDEAVEVEASYDAATVGVAFAAKPRVVQQARDRASSLREENPRAYTGRRND